MPEEKRRSDRILLTIPLTVKGTDTKGRTFQAEARTLVLNRHGGRIRTKHRLQADQRLSITNTMSRRSSEFRVVGPVSPFSDQGGEYGVEYLHPGQDIWGIQFPPLQHGEVEKSNALLECRKCGQVELLAVSLVEVEVLETSGILSRHCESCNAISQWSYAKKPMAIPESAGPGRDAQPGTAHPPAVRTEKRRFRRVALQLPVRICDYDGGVEITRSENISKGGFCFISEKWYQPGQGIMVTCPYDSKGANIEVRARVVNCNGKKGSRSRIYGVQFLETDR
ncbi:MAG TPA: PilZ domain-containing protein [Terriglobia bacterium]|nr:PilZ domain-containing protein [Terriglobia bacterium]